MAVNFERKTRSTSDEIMREVYLRLANYQTSREFFKELDTTFDPLRESLLKLPNGKTSKLNDPRKGVASWPTDLHAHGWVPITHIEGPNASDAPYGAAEAKRYLFLPNTKNPLDALGNDFIEIAKYVYHVKRGGRRERRSLTVYRFGTEWRKKERIFDMFMRDRRFLESGYALTAIAPEERIQLIHIDLVAQLLKAKGMGRPIASEELSYEMAERICKTSAKYFHNLKLQSRRELTRRKEAPTEN